MAQAFLRVIARRAQAGVLSCGQVHHLLHSHSETTSVNTPRITLPLSNTIVVSLLHVQAGSICMRPLHGHLQKPLTPPGNASATATQTASHASSSPGKG